ncbi:alpha/beta fold hydrolase [Salinimicrobium oceani]|uniref:Alpha/beta hydrolase n=1 Tax=Salinimicrobium oceani TaxID=2722702 RepID=A0ABX1D0C1_9FLAO|nr:alpha/beta hydrolase [Salinimicrobium oceani]NJW52603.1 alpha/beta hydrolase [Salinimicrobium oceani]
MKFVVLFFAVFTICHSSAAGERIITTSDGVNLYVKVKGTGTPLLYIHGGPGSASLWFENLSGEFMEKHFTMVYLDQRGVGRSGSPKDQNYSLDRMALDFEEVRQALGFEQWLTLGHSFGGILQMAYAERYPAVQKGMIMLNCTINLTESACESWIPKAAEFVGEKYSCEGDTVSIPQRMNEYGSKLRDTGLFWKMGSRNPDTFSRLDEASAGIENFNFDLSNHVLGQQEYWTNFKPLTASMQMPVLYFYGTSDFMVGPEHYKGLNFPKLMLWKNNGGHVPFIEDSTDMENAILAFSDKFQL